MADTTNTTAAAIWFHRKASGSRPKNSSAASTRLPAYATHDLTPTTWAWGEARVALSSSISGASFLKVASLHGMGAGATGLFRQAFLQHPEHLAGRHAGRQVAAFEQAVGQ